jgi:hypothetical protein
MNTPVNTPVAFEDFSALLSMDYDEEASNFCHHDYWQVTQAFRYYFGDKTEATYVDVPVGYLSDGASVPRFLWWLLPPQGDYGQAAVLHDYLCEHLTQTKNGQTVAITRVQADDALRNAMRDLGVPSWKRNVMFIAVAVYVKVCRIKGVDIDSKKAAYLAEYGSATATLPDVPQS